MGYKNQIFKDRVQVVSENKSFRERLQQEYEEYAGRIYALASYFKWDEQKRFNALNLSISQIRNVKVQNRLQELEFQMEQDMLQKKTKVIEYQKVHPNAVVMQFGENVYALNENDPRYSPVLNGLVFETLDPQESPFNNPVAIIHENEMKRKEALNKELAQKRALARQMSIR